MTLIEKLRVAQGDNAELCNMAAPKPIDRDFHAEFGRVKCKMCLEEYDFVDCVKAIWNGADNCSHEAWVCKACETKAKRLFDIGTEEVKE